MKADAKDGKREKRQDRMYGGVHTDAHSDNIRAGGGGCQAVCVSENGLLLAAADGGGNVVVFRKFPKWELYEDSVPGTPRLDAQDAGTSDQPLKHLSFSPTSSCAGSQRGGGGMKTFADDADNGYQPVALLRHEHRVRALSWATEPGQPVLAAGSADGRVRLWRPMGEAEVDVNVCGARLKNIKAGKEEIYAVVSIGQKICLGPEAGAFMRVTKENDENCVLKHSLWQCWIGMLISQIVKTTLSWSTTLGR